MFSTYLSMFLPLPLTAAMFTFYHISGWAVDFYRENIVWTRTIEAVAGIIAHVYLNTTSIIRRWKQKTSHHNDYILAYGYLCYADPLKVCPPLSLDDWRTMPKIPRNEGRHILYYSCRQYRPLWGLCIPQHDYIAYLLTECTVSLVMCSMFNLTGLGFSWNALPAPTHGSPTTPSRRWRRLVQAPPLLRNVAATGTTAAVRPGVQQHYVYVRRRKSKPVHFSGSKP